jgi:hypothetical protein
MFPICELWVKFSRSAAGLVDSWRELHFGRDMTDAEYDVLDEELTRTTPKLTTIPGVFTAQAKGPVKKVFSELKLRPALPPP